MSTQSRDRQSVSELNALRRRAVELRLGGQTLAVTQEAVGLSAPTIIAAMKSYREGGWDAVDVGPRGRPRTRSSDADHEEFKQQILLQATVVDTASAQPVQLWDTDRVQQWAFDSQAIKVSRSTASNWLKKWSIQPASRYTKFRTHSDASSTSPQLLKEHDRFARRARRSGKTVYWLDTQRIDETHYQLFAHDLRGHALWIVTNGKPTAKHYLLFLISLHQRAATATAVVLKDNALLNDAEISTWLSKSQTETLVTQEPAALENTTLTSATPMTKTPEAETPTRPSSDTQSLTHLQRLEAESIHIMREVVAEADNPVMLYSVGKDSAVMLHLARKAFYPAPPPFPLLHVDTGWKFKAMYEFRDTITKEYGVELLTHMNPEGIRQKVNPFTHGSAIHTDIMKTQGLKQALDEHQFDIAFGGARRDEEKSRAKERVFSFRSAQHRWDAKNQRPELWQLYNARKLREESIRVFPISNWTELDIWQYIHRENIPIVPLYYAAERPVVERDGSIIMVDDERMPLNDGEVPEMRSVRFRTLGCYPLTGAVESTANTLEDIIQEMLLTRTSERQGRMIDHDSAASMEKKKEEGYF